MNKTSALNKLNPIIRALDSLLGIFGGLSIKSKAILGGAIPIVLFCILGTICIISLHSLQTAAGWVNHTHVVIERAQNIVGAAVDMETGMRGYLLAGKEEFLEPYKKGKTRFERLTNELKKTVSDNPQQVQLLDDIQLVITDWQTHVTEPTITLRREIGDSKTMNDMAALVGEAKGKTYFDKFRGQIATFIKREEILMEKRKEIAKNSLDMEEIRKSTAWVDHTHVVIQQAQSIIAAAVDMETGMRGYLLSGKEEFLDPYRTGKARFTQLTNDLKATVSDNPAQVTLLGEIQTTITAWQSNVTEDMIQLRRDIGDAKTMDDMADLVGEARGKQYFDKFREQIALFIEREEVLLKERKAEADHTTHSTDIFIISAIVLALFICSIIAYVLIRSISKIKDASDVVSDIATGDLSVKINQLSSHDEIGVLLKSMQKMVKAMQSKVELASEISNGNLTVDVDLASDKDELGKALQSTIVKLNDVISNIFSSSSSVEQGVSEVAQGNLDLQNRTEMQAQTVEKVTSSIEEMSASVKENSESAKNVLELSQNAKKKAQQGNEVVNNVIQAMEAINDSSHKITDIVSVID